tara:strand:- start:8978 stop:11266 length:2289 start_codon:yes stop_codon:yes gene_type:complete
MARWFGEEHGDAVLMAAEAFREKCLLGDGSLFGAKMLWTADNIQQLKVAFVDNPQLGQASFMDKLQSQLQGSGAEVQKLAAEFLWVLLLFVHRRKFSPDKKRSNIGAIWALSGDELPKSTLLNDACMSGVGSPGVAFLTRMPDELEFFVVAMQGWKSLANTERAKLLDAKDPSHFCAWLTSQKGGDRRIFRHLLLFLLYPDHFERIASKGSKKDIVECFSKRLGERVPQMPEDPSPCEIDAALLKIRAELEIDQNSKEIDFYRAPLKDIWDPQTMDDEAIIEVDEIPASAPRCWIEKTIVRGRADRIDGAHALGKALWSPQRSISGSDIYKTMREVQPGDVVFHLTDNEAITAVSLVEGRFDDTFIGLPNTDWSEQPAYRIQLGEHEKLAPPLERKDFLDAEPFANQIRALLAKGEGRYFFNRNLELNQGAYLTEVSPELLQILDAAYWRASGKHLPVVSVEPQSESDQDLPDYNFDPTPIRKELFLDDDEIEFILRAWDAKKNLVLQGPPGVGKTFAADRLAKLLIRSNDPKRIGFVQFHQSYSYEDFVSGYRPNSVGGFDLRDGKFVQFCRRASADPHNRYVYIIDEINRGNLSKIFGELMMLIESDKRCSKWAVELAYGGEPFFVPKNVQLLGLMNTADRSLSLVDYALRRRFTFIDLNSKIGTFHFNGKLKEIGIDEEMISVISQKVESLNAEIVQDTVNLGLGFEIGHSYFCSPLGANETSRDWYSRIVRTEILPLLSEYWFDDRSKVEAWRDRLLS